MKGLLLLTLSPAVLLIAAHFLAASAFHSPQFSSATRSGSTRAFGISEWRDTFFDYPGTSDERRQGKETEGSPKEICILPFPFDAVLLQGETKQLRLYEERFIKLFDCCMEKHSGMVAMGLIAQSGIIQTVPICEIEAYNRMEGFGIFVTIRVVGRAQLAEITQQEPYLTGVCRELSDNIPANLELPNLVASNIENFMLLLSSMEHRLSEAMEESEDEVEEDAEMRKRIQIAKLVRAACQWRIRYDLIFLVGGSSLTPFLFY
jgi:Lon protease-like protein